MQTLGRIRELNKVTLECVPEHQGKPCNEEADRMAKEGAVEVPPNRFTAIPFSVGEKLIKKHLELQHQACTGCRLSKMLMRFPLSSRASELRQIVD